MEWLDFNKVVFSDVCLQVYLVFGFLLVCLVNMVGLMLVKFMCCVGELGVCCVLGVLCCNVFVQLLVEFVVIGLVGGIGGLVLVLFGLWVVWYQLLDYVKFVQFDLVMLLIIFVFVVGVSLLVGLLLVWCVCQVMFVL